MNVSAIIVTRGDVDCDEIVCSFPPEWETLLWDNGAKMLSVWRTPNELDEIPVPDLSVYGRYAAIEYASGDLIYVQDDDCVVSDPQAIVAAWQKESIGGRTRTNPWAQGLGHVVCNMSPEFRHDFYSDHALVGFGACFHRDAPARAFDYMRGSIARQWSASEVAAFHRTCDIVFTSLTPRVLVEVPHENLQWATDETRMYRQPEHIAERTRMLELVKQMRDD